VYRRGCWVKVLLGLLAIGLLLMVARGVGRLGWWQGYRMGQWSAQEERGEAPFHHPLRPRGPGSFGYRTGMGLLSALCGVGLLIKLGLVLLLVTLVGRLIGHRAWRPAYGPAPWRWHRHWYGPRYGPWCGPHGPRHPPEGRESFQAKVEKDSPDNSDEA
jgi:hypothetical protein